MQLARKTVAAGSVQSRARCVRVAAVQSKSTGASAWVASIAAAALIAGPASAGVVLEQPQLKKVFQDDGSAPAAVTSAIGKGPGSKAAAPKAAPAKKKQESVPSSSGGITPQSVALPAALLVVGGGAFALSSVDAGFAEFMRTAAVKDSSEIGAGYEEAIKSGAAGGKRKAGTGTTKAKAKGSKKGSAPTSPLGSLFGGDN